MGVVGTHPSSTGVGTEGGEEEGMLDEGITRGDTAGGTIRISNLVSTRSLHSASRPQETSSPYLNINMLMLFLSVSMGIILPSNRQWRVTCLEDTRRISLNRCHLRCLLLLQVLELGCRLYRYRFRSSRSRWIQRDIGCWDS